MNPVAEATAPNPKSVAEEKRSNQPVIERLKDFLGYLGVGNLNAVLHFGDMPHDKTIRNLEAFAGEVMPALKAEPSLSRIAA